MIPIFMLRTMLLAALAGVQGLSVVAEGDRTHVLIHTDAEVTVQHQMLTQPARIVVDLHGAEFALPQTRFLNIDRGGVAGLRSSQFQPGVVRVVIDLEQGVDYRVDRDASGVRISFGNPGGAFQAWSSGGPAARAPATQDEPMGRPVADGPGTPVADRRATQVPVSRPQVVQAPPQAQQPRITVEFRNTPIVDVLGTFADFSGRSIVPGQGVGNQTITAAIQGQPWDEAMRAILTGQGLTAAELASGIIMVTSRQQQRELETQEEMVTEAFRLEFVSADSVAPQVRELMGQGEQSTGTVAVNRATNSVIVSARQSVVERLRNLVPSLDQRTPQVTIQARLLSVRRSQFLNYGIRYELRDRNATGLIGATPGTEAVTISGDAIAAIGNAAEPVTGPSLSVVSALLLGRHSLLTWIDAVERLDLAELQADPVVTVLDHRTARIQVGQRIPIRVVDQGAAGAEGPQAQVRTEETGVILDITPHVVGADQVLLELHAERSEIQSFSAEGGYVFGTQETDTQVLLNDGQTAVISGLTTKDFTETLVGIPLLMHLPFIGDLFRNTAVEEVQEDLLIMVTPYIDRSGGF